MSMNAPLIPTQYGPYSYSVAPQRRSRLTVAATILLPLLTAGLVATTAVVVVDREKLQTQGAALQSARTVQASTAEDLAKTQDDLSSSKGDLLASEGKVDNLTKVVGDVKQGRKDDMDCLSGWLKAMQARNRDDLDGTMQAINDSDAVCHRAFASYGASLDAGSDTLTGA